MSNRSEPCEVCERRKRVEHQRNNIFAWYMGMTLFVGYATNSVYGCLTGAIIGLIVGWLVEKRIV